MRVLFCLSLLVTIANAINKGDYQKYMTLIQNEKFEEIKPILDSLEQHQTEDPETYVLIVNYHVKKGMKEVIVLEQGEPDSGMEALMLKDQTTGKDVGFMGSRMQIDTAFIIEGIQKLHAGTLKHPDRMDMWFGQAAVSRMIGYTDGIERALTGLLKRSMENKNNWKWGFENIEKKNTTKEFMLENLQAYTKYLFDVQKEKADSSLVRVSQLLIEYYPDLKYGYNNIGIIRNLQGEYEEAQQYLEKASKIEPDDLLILSNMGNNLSKMGEKKKLKKLIKRVKRIGSKDAKSLAEQLRTLL